MCTNSARKWSRQWWRLRHTALRAGRLRAGRLRAGRLHVLALSLLASVVSGCLATESRECSWGEYCPPGKVCDETHRWCVFPSQLTQCKGRENGAPCSVAGAIGLFFCTDDVCLPSTCGDGLKVAGEQCDASDLGDATCESFWFLGGTLACNVNCTYDFSRCTAPASCDDDVCDETDQCDGADLCGRTCKNLGFAGGTLQCHPNCSFDTAHCLLASCGDGVRQGSEYCDGADLGGQSCQGLGYVGGTLFCHENCSFDTRLCDGPSTCGNSQLDPGEACEDADLNGQTCADLGYLSGELYCTEGCSLDTGNCTTCGDGVQNGTDQCDGNDFGGQTCLTLGYYGGTIACAEDCQLVLSGCQSSGHCGDSIVNGAEECDGVDLAGETCFSQGYFGGTLGCHASCTFDPSQCHSCGNNVLDSAELCDGFALGGQTCFSLGYTGGSLGCTTYCTFDVNSCEGAGVCGNSALDPATEQCDGSNLGGSTCADLGHPGGTLACRPDCSFDISGCSICGNGVVDPGEACDDGNLVDWDGCTACEITEFRVNTRTVFDQSHPDVAMSADGRFVVCWQDWGGDGDGYGIFCQRFDTQGLPIGGEIPANTYTTSDQEAPAIAMDALGNFVVVWQSQGQDGSGAGVFAQRFDMQGQAVGAEFQVNTWTNDWQFEPDVVMAPNGRHVMVWTSASQDGSGMGVFGQVFDAQNQPVGGEFQANTFTADNQQQPAVGIAFDGRFAVAWLSFYQWGSGYDVYAQCYDEVVAPSGGEQRPTTEPAYYHSGDHDDHFPTVSMMPDGRYTVIWHCRSYHTVWQIRGRDFGSQCAPLQSQEFLVNSSTFDVYLPAISMSADGRPAVCFTGDNGSSTEIFCRLFSSNWVPLAADFQVNLYTQDEQSYSSVVRNPDTSDVVVVWQSYGQDGSGNGIYAQKFSAAGVAIGASPW